MEREPQYDVRVVCWYLLTHGLSVEDVADKLRFLGHLATPTEDRKGVSVSLEPYDGALHPRTTIIYQNPPLPETTKPGFASEPE